MVLCAISPWNSREVGGVIVDTVMSGQCNTADSDHYYQSSMKSLSVFQSQIGRMCVRLVSAYLHCPCDEGNLI